jgi:hypothetical protein
MPEILGPARSVFSRETLTNPSAFAAIAAVILLLVLVVQVGALQSFFTTTGLRPRPVARLRGRQLQHRVDLRGCETGAACPRTPPARCET